MIRFIVQSSLKYRGVVVAIGFIVIAYGIFTAMRTRLDVFPEFAPPQVVIQTEAPGLSPLEVEQLVTLPIENALGGMPDMVDLRAQSIQGLSVVTVVFKDKTDLFRARQMVAERLTEAVVKLPQGVKAPRMGPIIGSTCSVLSIGLTSTNRTLMELRSFADWTLKPRLLSVPGVAKVDIFGGEVQQLQIKVNPEKLVEYNIAIDDVINAARSATLLKGAGFIENPNQRLLLRIEGQSVSPADMESIQIPLQDGRRLALRDVALVQWGKEPKFGDALVNGVQGVILLVSSQLGANTLEVTANVEAALKEMSELISAEQIAIHLRLFRPANFIEIALKGMRESLITGALLVGIVLYGFLLKFRTAFISFIAIPLSLLSAVIILDMFGVTINTFTLGGFAIAIGVVVDDAIIDVENIIRRLRENQASKEPRPWSDVILDASLEVRQAVVYATFIVALVFLPVLTMGGVHGRLFAPLGVAFILATLASLVVALTITPVLCLLLIRKDKALVEPFYIRWFKAAHRAILARLMPHTGLLALVIAIVCAGSIYTIKFFGGEFLPEFREGHYFIHMSAIPGTSLEESIRLGKLVTEELKKIPKIRAVSQQAGRAEMGEDPFGPHYSEIHVDLEPCEGEEEELVVQKMREVLSRIPGISTKIMPFLVERMEETLSGATAEVVVNIFGDDIDELDRIALKIKDTLGSISGAVDVQCEVGGNIPELVIKLKADKLQYWNANAGNVMEALSASLEGYEAGEVYHGTKVIDVVVILSEKVRQHPEALGKLPVRNNAGVIVPLSELADIRLTSGRHSIAHRGIRRVQQVTCNVQGRDVVSFMEEAKLRIKKEVVLPRGFYIVYGGAAEARAQAQQELIVHSCIAGVLIIILLAIVFKHWRNLLLVLANLPFALVGGVLAVFASGGILSIGTLVGFVTLFGLSTRNSIMLISHFEHLVKNEGLEWNIDTAIRGATERLLPVTMTALVTALGLLPVAIGSGEAGREIEGPMAIVILGGLFTSTVLNLFLLPVFAHRFGKFLKN